MMNAKENEVRIKLTLGDDYSRVDYWRLEAKSISLSRQLA